MKPRIFTTAFSSVYPMYVQKAEKKGRAKEEVDKVICWLTGYDKHGLRAQIEREVDFETFFFEAPQKCSMAKIHHVRLGLVEHLKGGNIK